MRISKSIKSSVLKTLIKGCPKIMNSDAVRTLTTDPDKAVFGMEDAVEAQGEIAMDEGKVDGVDETLKETSLDVFPNLKLQAEVEICKEMDRTTYDEFSEVWDQLGKIISKVDEDYGPLVDRFLADEIISIDGVDKDTVDKVINANVSLTTINSETAKIFN